MSGFTGSGWADLKSDMYLVSLETLIRVGSAGGGVGDLFLAGDRERERRDRGGGDLRAGERRLTGDRRRGDLVEFILPSLLIQN